VNLLGVMAITVGGVALGSGACFWMLNRARETDTTVWILEHIICPIIRLLVLMVIVSQMYPAVNPGSDSLDFWRVLGQQDQFADLLNILFFTGLALAFIPVVNHAVIALPLQSMLGIAMVFRWQYQDEINNIVLLPSLFTVVKIVAFMILAYLVTREASIRLSRWFDRRYNVSGSIGIVADAIYLLLQIPVILIYCEFLRQQLP